MTENDTATAMAEFAIASNELVNELVRQGFRRKEAISFAAIYMANLPDNSKETDGD